MTRRKAGKFKAFLWHRRIGLAAMALVLVLAVTGIMLNHTESLALDERYVGNALLLNWYGIQPDGEPLSFRVTRPIPGSDKTGDSHLITAWDGRLFFDTHEVAALDETVHGAMATETLIVVALDDELILLSWQGELVEQVSTRISFNTISRLGEKYLRPVIETVDPLYYMADEHILDWDVISNDGIHWVEPVALGDSEYEALLQAYRGKGLTLERVILDLHSGRIFGRYGNLLMDAAALALIWLALSGLWVWGSRRHKMRQKRHYRKHHRPHTPAR